jgi:hypothetical protein
MYFAKRSLFRGFFVVAQILNKKKLFFLGSCSKLVVLLNIKIPFYQWLVERND